MSRVLTFLCLAFCYIILCGAYQFFVYDSPADDMCLEAGFDGAIYRDGFYYCVSSWEHSNVRVLCQGSFQTNAKLFYFQNSANQDCYFLGGSDEFKGLD